MKKLSEISYQISSIPKLLRTGAWLLLSVCCFLLSAQAQSDDFPKDAAPPPLKVVTSEDRKLLDAETNVKKRTQLSMELMEIRLKNAEEFVAETKFQDTINEIGTYQALLEDVLDYLVKKDDNGKKVDDNFKRLEIGLRKTSPRLELIRREMPYRFAYYIQKAQKFVREARAKAIEPLFGDSVVLERKP